MKWYEYRNPYSSEHCWWTQRYGKRGICFQINKAGQGLFDLLICDTYKKSFTTLNEAMDTAYNYYKTLV